MTEPILPDAPADSLNAVPLLGPARRQALAALGITTLDGLRALSPDELAAVKGIGAANAAKIIAWLAVNAVAVAAPPLDMAPPVLPPPPPDFDPAPSPPASASDSLDPTLAAVNQALFDARNDIDAAVAALREKIPARNRVKTLERQLDKLETAVSETKEGLDTAPAKSVLEIGKAVSQIARELDKAVGGGKLSDKKQNALADELRARRRKLEKALGG